MGQSSVCLNSGLYDIALHDGHATSEVIRAEAAVALIGLRLVRGLCVSRVIVPC